MNKAIQSIYDEIWARGWSEGTDWMPIKRTQYRLSKYLFKKFPLVGDVLDVGGGNASFWKFSGGFIKNISSLTICDVSPYVLKKAQEKNIKTMLMDMTAPQLGFNEKYDAICCFEVLEHIEEDAKAIQNCYAMLKPNSKLYISVPRKKEFWSASDEKSFHVRRYETEELIQKLEDAGFAIVHYFTWGSRLFQMYQKLKSNVDPSFGKVKKDKVLVRAFSLLIYHIFKYEDWMKSKDGIFLYVVAQKSKGDE